MFLKFELFLAFHKRNGDRYMNKIEDSYTLVIGNYEDFEIFLQEYFELTEEFIDNFIDKPKKMCIWFELNELTPDYDYTIGNITLMIRKNKSKYENKKEKIAEYLKYEAKNFFEGIHKRNNNPISK